MIWGGVVVTKVKRTQKAEGGEGAGVRGGGTGRQNLKTFGLSVASLAGQVQKVWEGQAWMWGVSMFVLPRPSEPVRFCLVTNIILYLPPFCP